jgi:hypothetical protein
LRTFPPGLYNIEYYIGMYCEASTKKLGSQVKINKMTSINLQIVLYMSRRIMRSTIIHQDSHAQMHYEIQCLHATFFYWSTTMLTCMKKQLTNCRRRTKRKIVFGTMLCSLFLERVPRLNPRGIVQGHIAFFLELCRWEALFPQQGARRVKQDFDEKLFDWCAHEIPMVEDYPYAGIKFLRDPDIPIPLGEECGEIGMYFLDFFFFF